MATLSLGRLCYSCLLGRAPEGAAASQHAKPSGALARILTRPSQSHTFLAVFMVMAALYLLSRAKAQSTGEHHAIFSACLRHANSDESVQKFWKSMH